QATVVEHFVRHGERMTYFSVVNDPVNLDEPFPKTSNLVHVPNDPNSWTMPCDDGEIIPGQPKDRVDNYLWGQHPFLQEFVGGNIAVQAGNEGAMVVDSGAGRLSDKVIAAIRTISNKPIQFVINTSFHPDHIGGNAKLHAAGVDPEANGGNLRTFADAGVGAT